MATMTFTSLPGIKIYEITVEGGFNVDIFDRLDTNIRFIYEQLAKHCVNGSKMHIALTFDDPDWGDKIKELTLPKGGHVLTRVE